MTQPSDAAPPPETTVTSTTADIHLGATSAAVVGALRLAFDEAADACARTGARPTSIDTQARLGVIEVSILLPSEDTTAVDALADHFALPPALPDGFLYSRFGAAPGGARLTVSCARPGEVYVAPVTTQPAVPASGAPEPDAGTAYQPEPEPEVGAAVAAAVIPVQVVPSPAQTAAVNPFAAILGGVTGARP